MRRATARIRTRELRFVLRAMGTLLATGVALRLHGLAHARRFAARPAAASVREPLRPERIARLLFLASRFGPYRPGCLVRSLALQRLLRRHGIESRLRIGVRKRRAVIEAHAWVEHEGRPLLEADGVSSEYLPFEALPSAAAK